MKFGDPITTRIKMPSGRTLVIETTLTDAFRPDVHNSVWGDGSVEGLASTVAKIAMNAQGRAIEAAVEWGLK